MSENEMKEIEEVMFNMGMTDNFTSHVSKSISGKHFLQDLAEEIELFLDRVINTERFSGVIGLVDLFCLYNRARGTDLVGPEDLNSACQLINQSSTKYMIKQYTKSGIKTIQLKTFSETGYYEKISAALGENEGMTADKLATHFKINVGVMKEHIQEAELQGFICVDDSHEGLRYHPNLIKTFDIASIA
jgi:ESCRT-II complex subunit VPS36